MPQVKYYLTHGGQIDAVTLAPGDLIAIIETPDGVDPIRAVNAVANGLATANPRPLAPTAKPEPAAEAPAPVATAKKPVVIPPPTRLPAK